MLHGLNLGVVSAQASAYLLKQSLLFNDNDSAYLNRTPSTAGNRKTFTFSVWHKRGSISSYPLYSAYVDANNRTSIQFGGLHNLQFVHRVSSTNIIQVETSAVFRDPNAWYHIVVAVDTTQATSTDRVKIWVNGTLVSDTHTTAAPLNTDTYINSTNAHNVGAIFAIPQYQNGLAANNELVDGAALDPTSFGEEDADGYWNPIDFTGATTTDNVSVGGTASAESTFLTFVPANAFDGNTSTRWVSSATPAWLEYDRGSGNGVISTSYSISCGPSGSASTADMPKNWTIEGYNGSSWDTLATVTNEAAWSLGETRLYTFTNTTSYEKYRIDITLQQGGGNEIEVGELRFYAAGTGYGTNGFVLNFSDTSNFGDDTSSNGNDYTPNNFTASDQLADVPTDDATNDKGSFCTWNPLMVNGTTAYQLSDGNLTAADTVDSGWGGNIFTPTTGKWYWEFTLNDSANPIVGCVHEEVIASGDLYDSSGADGFAQYGGNQIGYAYAPSATPYKYNNSTRTGYGTAGSAGDIVSIALELDNGAIWFARNGTWQNSATVGEIEAGTTTNAAFTSITSGRYTPLFHSFTGTDTVTLECGQTGFAYTPPTGFKALATHNLPDPTIAKPSDYFNTVLYTGNGVAIGSGGQSITGVGFQPDFVWIKNRDDIQNHKLADVVRGIDTLESNTTNAERVNAESFASFDSDGFTVGSQNNVNGSGNNIVAWCWKAGGAGVSNTDGTITSSVSVNTTSGFSIVSYTGNTTGTPTVGHGLGVAPDFLIFKDRDAATEWLVWHSSLANTEALELNSTAAKATGWTGHFNSTTPGASVITLGTSGSGQGRTNPNGNAMICYAWNEVEGFSKFGSYTGNGSTDGPFVWCGFRPAFVLVKSSSAVDNWILVDNKRDPQNTGTQKRLFAESTSAESAAECFDFLSNGFKARRNVIPNVSGNTYIFAAFAEHPFQGGTADSRSQGRAR